MTVSTISAELLILLQPNLVMMVHYHYQPEYIVKRFDCRVTVKVQTLLNVYQYYIFCTNVLSATKLDVLMYHY